MHGIRIRDYTLRDYRNGVGQRVGKQYALSTALVAGRWYVRPFMRWRAAEIERRVAAVVRDCTPPARGKKIKAGDLRAPFDRRATADNVETIIFVLAREYGWSRDDILDMTLRVAMHHADLITHTNADPRDRRSRPTLYPAASTTTDADQFGAPASPGALAALDAAMAKQ